MDGLAMRIAELECQSHTLQVLVYLRMKGESYIAQMMDDPFPGVASPTLYRALAILQGLELISQQVKEGPKKGGLVRMYMLTAKGQKVADHLLGVEELLKGSPRKRNSD